MDFQLVLKILTVPAFATSSNMAANVGQTVHFDDKNADCDIVRW